MAGSFRKLTVLASLCALLRPHPAAAHPEEGSIFRMSRDGSSIVRISAEGMGWRTSTPRFSPDGQRLLYVARNGNENEFHVISALGEKLLRVPVPSHITSVAGVSWLDDGTIAFGGRTEEPEVSFDIYVMKLGAGEPVIRRIVENGLHPAWSPDERFLVFTSYRDGNLEVYLADGDGGNPRNLTRHEGHDGRPAWAGHGREIAFVSNRDWNFHIYRMAADGSNLTRLTTGYVEDREPVWSPDGESICFVSNRGEPFLDGLRRWLSNWLTEWPDDSPAVANLPRAADRYTRVPLGRLSCYSCSH